MRRLESKRTGPHARQFFPRNRIDQALFEPVQSVIIVATIVLERRRIGTSAESGQYNDHSCRAYLQKGRVACNAALLNKEKLETAMLDQIQEQILKKKSAAISSLFSNRLASPT